MCNAGSKGSDGSSLGMSEGLQCTPTSLKLDITRVMLLEKLEIGGGPAPLDEDEGEDEDEV